MTKPKLTLVKPPKKTRVEEIFSALDAPPLFDEEECNRMMGDSAANGSNDDPMVFTGKAELTLRQMIAKYCFDRLPLTYGEFQGLLNYCDFLDIIAGEGIVKKELQKDWSKPGAGLWAKYRPAFEPAGALYISGDLAGLRKYHKDTDALTRIGKSFSEFSDF